MTRNLIALAAGLLFGFGLILSGMYDPPKVLGFLDLAGDWDPSLAFVMAGAIAVALPAFRGARSRRTAALDGDAIELPQARAIDVPLVVGALIFGAGWGLTGVCPGPGILDLGFLSSGAAIVVAAMAAGMAAHLALSRGLPILSALAQDA